MKTLTLVFLAVVLLASCSESGGKTLAEGTFESTEVVISAEANGRITALTAEEGSSVSKGQKLGKIDDIQLVLKREQMVAARGQVESSRPDISVQVAALVDQLATAKSELARIEKLVAANAASSKQQDDAKAQVSTLERQLAAQRSSLEKSDRGVSGESTSLSFQIAQLDDQITKSTVVSPLDGTILSSYAQPGELAVVGKPLVKVADLSRVYLRAYVTAADLSGLKIGGEVKVKADSGKTDSKFYTGKISWISDKAEFTPKTIQTRDERAALVYAVKVAVVNDGYLKLGMYGAIVEGQ